MIYLQVEHVDDEDYDYFSFSNIHRAIRYIFDENISRYSLSDFPILKEDDYTYIEE